MSNSEIEQDRRPQGGSPKSARESLIPTLVVVLGLTLLVQIASQFVPPYVLPSPATILASVWEILRTQYTHMAVTGLRLVVALAFAMAFGVFLGILMGIFPRIRPYLRSLIIIDTGIPALSWMLLAIFWFSAPEARIFFILSVILVPFYALSIYDGIRALPRDHVEMIESFRPSRWQVLRYLILPHIVPYVLSTTKSVIGYAIRMAIFAELVASSMGIGSRMSLAQSMFRIDHVLGWTLILVVANVALQALLNAVEKVLLKWRAEAVVR